MDCGKRGAVKREIPDTSSLGSGMTRFEELVT